MARSSTTFKKGQVTNPKGRPKEVAHVRELARKYTKEAISTLAQICMSGDKDSARVAAAIALLDRGYGKAPQKLDVNIFDGVADEDLLAKARAILDKQRDTDGRANTEH